MLVSVSTYQTITGDVSSATSQVEDALLLAQRELEEYLGRGLESLERTERCRVFPDGRMYPRCTPITAVPDGSTVYGAGVAAGGEAVTTSWLTPDTHADLTYTGGYDPAEDDMAEATYVPVTLQRAVSWAAKAVLTPADGLEIPDGATSISVGDVSVSWGAGGSPATGEIGWPDRVRRWRWRKDMAA